MQLKLLALSFLLSLSLAAPAIEERTITGYTIKLFTRNCSNPHICTYNFIIDTGEEQQPCTVIHETPVQTRKRTGPLATTEPFASKPCLQNNRWVISWGWDYPGDFTVMTVVHKPNSKAAFFGYKSPNANLPVASYPDVGPNKVQNI